MQRGRVIIGLLVIGVVLGATASARAEEITLKDGQKIIGTIVGYEKDMFRVETTYGIALVRKDKVASIQVSKPEAENQATKPAGVTPGNKPEAARPAVPPPEVVRIPPSQPLPAGPPAAPPPILKPPASEAATGKLVTPPPPPVSHPLDVPIPAHLQDHVEGNTYFSDTFQFSMYKPPDWKIIEDVPKETGSGIMAMGTDDEMTLLIVDRQVWSGTPKLTSDQVEAKLRQTYQGYQRISENSFQCDGQPATYRKFTGILDGAEWHGVAVHVIHGNTVFGIIGLTSSESYQFQEAIFNKIVRTFHFKASPGSTGASASP
jgi:hypothetical protein